MVDAAAAGHRQGDLEVRIMASAAVATGGRRGPAAKWRLWRAQLDALLWDLESANLRRCDRCPPGCWLALAQLERTILPLSRGLPSACGSTSEALDLVFALQEVVQRASAGATA